MSMSRKGGRELPDKVKWVGRNIGESWGRSESVKDYTSVKLKEEFQESWKEELDELDQLEFQAKFSGYGSLIRWCGDEKALSEGKRLHAHIMKSGHKRSTVLANLLIQMYCKCGALELSSAVFAEMHKRNVFSWTIMIGAYIEHGQGEDALRLFKKMQLEGVIPNRVTYVTILSACTNHAALTEGKKIHAHIVGSGFESDVVIGTALLSMYGKCGSLEDARKMFDKMTERSVISWNSMIAVYAQHRQGKKAFQLFQQMQLEGMKPNRVTFLSILGACASHAALAQGKRMHVCIVHNGFESDVFVANALVSMYGKCGSLEDARGMFNKMPKRNVVSWNAMIAAYAQHGQGKQALRLFRQMQLEGVIPNAVTFVSIFSACASQAALVEGKRMHTLVAGSEFESDIIVGNAIVNMYGKCGSLEDARRMLDKMPKRNVVSWTSMITAYAQHGQSKEAVQLFHQMQLEGVIPNKVTFVSVIDACASQADVAEGKQMHARIVSKGFESDVIVGNSLINMYAKCGSPDDAWNVFCKMPEQDVVSWTTMIAAYAQQGQCTKALQLFQQMQLEGIMPNEVTFISILDACANQASLGVGKRIHACIVGRGFESDVVVGTALVKMYNKCGSLEDAQGVFGKMRERNAVSWTSMIAAYAQHGNGKEALQLFQQMQIEGMIPDNVTFVHVLSACNHTGLVEEGMHYFVSMLQDHGIIPLVEHYNCMIDLLGRGGWLDEGEDLINNMPFQPNVKSWMTLLGACQKHLDMRRGKCAAEHVFELDPENAAPYVCLSNIYATAGRWGDAVQVRKLMDAKSLNLFD